jgi:hypothetical protein
MRYTKPSILNVKKASSVIMGAIKLNGTVDNPGVSSTTTAYRSDE